MRNTRGVLLSMAVLLCGFAAAGQPAHSAADFGRIADELKRSLAAAPDDADNWVSLGRTLAELQRWPDAKDAFAHAIALRPDAPALHAQLGEVLTLAAGGMVTGAARAEFAQAPDDPRSRFYFALAVAQGGDKAEAIRQLGVLADSAPADARWRQMVLDELKLLEADAAQDGRPPVSAVDAAEAELARLGPVAPQTVDELEQRVLARPHETGLWLDLARAYRARGDADRATDALRRANGALPANRELLLVYANALADGIKGDILPPAFVMVMQQVNAIDPDQQDALWYLGLAAAQRGDAHRALKFWQRLAQLLPAGSRERKTLQERLDALP